MLHEEASCAILNRESPRPLVLCLSPTDVQSGKPPLREEVNGHYYF